MRLRIISLHRTAINNPQLKLIKTSTCLTVDNCWVIIPPRNPTLIIRSYQVEIYTIKCKYGLIRINRSLRPILRRNGKHRYACVKDTTTVLVATTSLMERLRMAVKVAATEPLAIL